MCIIWYESRNVDVATYSESSEVIKEREREEVGYGDASKFIKQSKFYCCI